MKFVRIFTTIIVSFLIFSTFVSAHSGRTDSQGGHNDNKNASGLGSYHYHHGYGPHLHPNGICPYLPKDSINIDNQPHSILVGEQVKLSYVITSYSGMHTINWSSSNTSVLTVDGGIINAISPGTAAITANLHNGSKTFYITVEEVPITSIAILGSQEEIPINEIFTVQCDIEPVNATYKDVIWKSSDPSVATITENGEIHALAEGSTTILVETFSGKSTFFDLSVYAVKPRSVEIANYDPIVYLGSNPSLTVEILPSDTSNPFVIWNSSNDSICYY